MLRPFREDLRLLELRVRRLQLGLAGAVAFDHIGGVARPVPDVPNEIVDGPTGDDSLDIPALGEDDAEGLGEPPPGLILSFRASLDGSSATPRAHEPPTTPVDRGPGAGPYRCILQLRAAAFVGQQGRRQ
jgi:hypothetical protein